MRKILAKNSTARTIIASARRAAPSDHVLIEWTARPDAHNAKQLLCTALSLTGTPMILNQYHGPCGHSSDADDSASRIKQGIRKPYPICSACRGVKAVAMTSGISSSLA